jgi:hypothetical protein
VGLIVAVLHQGGSLAIPSPVSNQIAIGIAALSLAVAAFGLLVTVGSTVRIQRLENRIKPRHENLGLPAGSSVPEEVLSPFLDGRSVVDWLQGPSLLILASSTCSPCQDLVQAMNEHEPREIGGRLLIIQPEGDSSERLREAARFQASWGIDLGSRVRKTFRTEASPHSFLIGNGKVIDHVVGPDLAILVGSTPPVAQAGTRH